MSGETVVTIDYGADDLPQRFWDKVYPCPITGCWLWGAARHNTLPYGIWTVSGRTRRAHVSAFLAAGGAVDPERSNVLHSCDQPACVRPEHLRAGTQADNVDDARRRNRLAVGTGSSLTPAQVEKLRERYAAGEHTSDLAAAYSISRVSISLIVRGLRWSSASGPLTFERPRKGFPHPARQRAQCKHGHELTPENTHWKPNSRCRDGFERQCVTCRKRQSSEAAARRKAMRAAMKEQIAA